MAHLPVFSRCHRSLTYGVASPQDSDKTSSVKAPSSKPVVEDLEDVVLEKATISAATSQYAGIINRINRWLFLLIPWASRRFGFLMARNTHVFHLGFIVTLAGLFDIPNRWFLVGKTASNTITATTTHRPLKRLIVIGDSLAVGMGSVDVFDAEKNNSVPFCRIENLEHDLGPGPVFPRVLAETLANNSRASVHWRSAGVDGGDAQLIQDFCLDVIKEEVSRGRPPDVVVILCGSNDLKYYVSNPFQSAGPRTFRARLKGLIEEIKRLAPNTKVVLSSVPAQMFHKNSPLNIFPLNFFLDTIVGFWDSQKKLVADIFPSRDVLYLGVRPVEIFEWYQFEESKEAEREKGDNSLIAADGIHPNAKCYTLWANSLGNKLVAAMNSKR
jgi:lysophospholipase L1-like esterase